MNFSKKNENFTAIIEVSKSPQIVFKSITNDVAKWWGGQDLTGNSTNLNDEFTVRHPGAHYSKQRLVEVVPDKKVVWLVTESMLNWLQKDKHEWTDIKMIFDISIEGNKTILYFTHEGLIPEKECYSLCRDGWNTVIKEYLYYFITENKAHFYILNANMVG